MSRPLNIQMRRAGVCVVIVRTQHGNSFVLATQSSKLFSAHFVKDSKNDFIARRDLQPVRLTCQRNAAFQQARVLQTVVDGGFVLPVPACSMHDSASVSI